MDFFRSILADDPDPKSPENHTQSQSNDLQNQSLNHQQTKTKIEADEDEDDDSTSNINSSDDGSSSSISGGGLWTFGDLVKTLTTKSESVIETYRRDLKEFGTGLRKESDLFREVASRAVKELPSSIDAGSSAIDVVLKSTVDIIAQGKEALLLPSDVDESDGSEKRRYSDRNGVDLMRYSRFDVQLNAIRSAVRTYCEDPEDLEDYRKWKLGFVVGDRRDEIEKLVGDDGDLSGVYAKVVPNEVDDGVFWCRYFYKVHKLKQQEDVRAKLVKRSLSVDDEEELSWDVDDDDDDDDDADEDEDDNRDERQQQQHEEEGDDLRSITSKSQDSDDVVKNDSHGDEIKTQISKIVDEDKEMQINVISVDENNVNEPEPSGNVSTVEKAESVSRSNEKVDQKVDSGEVKDSNVVVKSVQPSFQEDDDLEWDEIEDLGNSDDMKVSHGETTNKADLCRRLSTAADEEDLSWDIEDDDDDDDKTVKAGNK